MSQTTQRAPTEPIDPVPSKVSDTWLDPILLRVTEHLQERRFPTATYRVQLNRDCTFLQLADYVPTLSAMGISHVYLAPFLEARPGSVHGYDIVNHARINPEIGTMDDLRKLRQVLDEHGMGLIADVVPNHMAASSNCNAWWQDVLENGPASQFAGYFDIDWQPSKADLHGKVLLPILGEQFGKVLESGQFRLAYEDGCFAVYYFENRLPLAPRSYALILALGLADLQSQVEEENSLGEADSGSGDSGEGDVREGEGGPSEEHLSELLSILTAIRNLPDREVHELERLIERRREKEVIKRRLHDLSQKSPWIRAYIDRNVQRFNGQVGKPASFDCMEDLLGAQPYRLSFWRVAVEEINYRRFFDINELAAIRTELPEVFEQTHQLLFDGIEEGIIDGLRIDHPDGLLDPREYFQQLQRTHFLQLCSKHFHDLDTERTHGIAWRDAADRLRLLWNSAASLPGSPLATPLYVLVEKILGEGEYLPDDWNVHGTVGYEFLNKCNALFVDTRNGKFLTALYHRFIDQSIDFSELTYHCKRLVVRMSMASELAVLGNALDRISERNRLTRDFTQSALTRALQEVIAAFSVYRTYIKPGRILERDRWFITQAVEKATDRNPAMDASVFQLIKELLLLDFPLELEEGEVDPVLHFTGKFQQLTGPIMAKSVEDTAFYQYNRLVSLNEVGGEPDVFGIEPQEMHAFAAFRQLKQPYAMNCSSTHDTKRSEDVRSRINVLTEIPKVWKEKVQSWARWNKRHKTKLGSSTLGPSKNAEYLFYQTLIGTWPGKDAFLHAPQVYLDRLKTYMVKVAREAKVETSWVRPNEEYEQALIMFVDKCLQSGTKFPFFESLDAFVKRVEAHGWWNSLSQLTLKTTLPGIPDFYQGSEIWNLTLVDPDNRHRIDLHERTEHFQNLTARVSNALPEASNPWQAWVTCSSANGPGVIARIEQLLNQLMATASDGSIKLLVSTLLLNCRQQFPDVFQRGEYLAVESRGQYARGLFSFAKISENLQVLVVTSRFLAEMEGFQENYPEPAAWGDTRIVLPVGLQGSRLTELFTQRTFAAEQDGLQASELLRSLPIAVLIATDNDGACKPTLGKTVAGY